MICGLEMVGCCTLLNFLPNWRKAWASELDQWHYPNDSVFIQIIIINDLTFSLFCFVLVP
jgi:hypothetical protein